VSNFIVQALKGEDITIYGDGKQSRSFCYVDDLVEGMIRMMDSADDFTGPVNIGNTGEFTMLELAEKVIALTGSRSKIRYLPLPQDDPRQRRPDTSLAKKMLDWEPTDCARSGPEAHDRIFRRFGLNRWHQPASGRLGESQPPSRWLRRHRCKGWLFHV